MKFLGRIIRRQMERQSTTNGSIFCRPLITKTSGFTLGRRLINQLADNEASALGTIKAFLHFAQDKRRIRRKFTIRQRRCPFIRAKINRNRFPTKLETINSANRSSRRVDRLTQSLSLELFIGRHFFNSKVFDYIH